MTRIRSTARRLRGGGASGGGEVSSSVTVSGPKKPKIMIAISGGTGSGYVTGTTEGNNTVKSCCIGNLVVVVLPEIGYHVSPQLVGLGRGAHRHPARRQLRRPRDRRAGRTAAPSLRTVAVGPGRPRDGADRRRHPAQHDQDRQSDDAAWTPTSSRRARCSSAAASAITKNLSSNIAFIADLSALAGIAVVDHLGSAPKLNNGVSADLSLGLALGF